MNTRASKLALSLGALLAASSAWASTTANMTATATIQPQCAVGNAAPLTFGNLVMLEGAAPTAVDSTASTTFDAICTNGTQAPKFAYGSANHVGTDFLLRGSGNWAGSYIRYYLYGDADQQGVPIVGRVATAYTGGFMGFMGSGATESLTLSAKILADDKRGLPPSAYTDTITITVSWTP
jgi:spore coat protein U-like protein